MRILSSFWERKLRVLRCKLPHASQPPRKKQWRYGGLQIWIWGKKYIREASANVDAEDTVSDLVSFSVGDGGFPVFLSCVLEGAALIGSVVCWLVVFDGLSLQRVYRLSNVPLPKVERRSVRANCCRSRGLIANNRNCVSKSRCVQDV
ncbi:MAG: hypothetical protein FRX48_00520 [Lasallia pustulata]|uniref:Uncharacterized protein n=1 Tax=Lasallia pustulata TaxID=136370 RepID=A0A5M8Q230_9LECA|nr:MAG: hypothetical protein FRX48_00520 [Lasallia pustulata]